MIDKNNYDSNQLALESIRNVEDLLQQGRNFSDLAKEYSEDFVTKDIGGDLEYFEEGIFPVEFEDEINELELNQISKIVELEDTLHILKITEKNIEEPLPKDDVISSIKNELLETESFALMKDDYDQIDQLVLENAKLEEIAATYSKEILSSGNQSLQDYDFYNDHSEIKDYIFSPDTSLNAPYLFESVDSIVIVSLKEITQSELQEFSEVSSKVSSMLTESKSKEKIILIENEIIAIEDEIEREKFINTYSYITTDSFVDIKRFSSLIPSDVLNVIFKSSEGSELNIESLNGDRYIINILNFKDPTVDELQNVNSRYQSFGEETMSFKMTDIINEDLFVKAKLNLNDVVFNSN